MTKQTASLTPSRVVCLQIVMFAFWSLLLTTICGMLDDHHHHRQITTRPRISHITLWNIPFGLCTSNTHKHVAWSRVKVAPTIEWKILHFLLRANSFLRLKKCHEKYGVPSLWTRLAENRKSQESQKSRGSFMHFYLLHQTTLCTSKEIEIENVFFFWADSSN